MPPDNSLSHNNTTTDYSSILNFFKSISVFFIICLSSFILLNAYYALTYKKEREIISQKNKTNNANIIKGIHITHHFKEQKVFAIQAKTASIKNKKIGFFRIGGLKQLELENMIVDYHEPQKEAAEIVGKERSSKNESHDLLSYFSRAGHSMPLLKKELAGFVAYHATIRYHHPDNLLTIINAPYMEIRDDRKSLHFQKNVAVHFQNKFLLCKNIIFEVNRSRLVSKNKYTLIKNGVIQKGKGCCMNLRLEAMP
jgi:hypothetical protein